MQNAAVQGIDVDLKGAAVSVYAFHDDGILGIAFHFGGIQGRVERAGDGEFLKGEDARIADRVVAVPRRTDRGAFVDCAVGNGRGGSHRLCGFRNLDGRRIDGGVCIGKRNDALCAQASRVQGEHGQRNDQNQHHAHGKGEIQPQTALFGAYGRLFLLPLGADTAQNAALILRVEADGREALVDGIADGRIFFQSNSAPFFKLYAEFFLRLLKPPGCGRRGYA